MKNVTRIPSSNDCGCVGTLLMHKKFESFGWSAAKCNGHNSKDIYNKIKSRSLKKPFALIAKTIKGYPVSFMKNVPKWHYRSPNKIEYLQAIREINNL